MPRDGAPLSRQKPLDESRQRLRRFTDHTPVGKPYELAADHIAVRRGRSLFRKGRVIWAGFADRILKSGTHNRKIGGRVVKGAWAGMPIFTLTLEERATCPGDCRHWRDCYGNSMNWPERLIADDTLLEKLDAELCALAHKYPTGFVVRLHVLGDFWSGGYVVHWLLWLKRLPELHIWGYTQRAPESAIGRRVQLMNRRFAGRCVIRFSNRPDTAPAALTLDDPQLRGRLAAGIVCPVESGDAECCATCALCWSVPDPIIFLRH